MIHIFDSQHKGTEQLMHARKLWRRINIIKHPARSKASKANRPWKFFGSSPDGKRRGKLIIVIRTLAATAGESHNTCEHANELGFHTISLGKSAMSDFKDNPSVWKSRLIDLLRFMQNTYPGNGWEEFLNDNQLEHHKITITETTLPLTPAVEVRRIQLNRAAA